ncbi:MAG: hypothetical protein H7296_01805 [Bacteroidia bacterium]|nr:hypothetical protein [Bacteroidia bacterium]
MLLIIFYDPANSWINHEHPSNDYYSFKRLGLHHNHYPLFFAGSYFNRNELFTLFRKYEDNFNTAIVYCVDQLISGNEKEQQSELIKPGAYSTLIDPIEADKHSHLYFKKKTWKI